MTKVVGASEVGEEVVETADDDVLEVVDEEVGEEVVDELVNAELLLVD